MICAELRKALEAIGNPPCGCRPICQCLEPGSLAIYREWARETALAALALPPCNAEKELEQAKAELADARKAWDDLLAERYAARKALAEANEMLQRMTVACAMNRKRAEAAERELSEANEKIEQQRLVIMQFQRDSAKEEGK